MRHRYDNLEIEGVLAAVENKVPVTISELSSQVLLRWCHAVENSHEFMLRTQTFSLFVNLPVSLSLSLSLPLSVCLSIRLSTSVYLSLPV